MPSDHPVAAMSTCTAARGRGPPWSVPHGPLRSLLGSDVAAALFSFSDPLGKPCLLKASPAKRGPRTAGSPPPRTNAVRDRLSKRDSLRGKIRQPKTSEFHVFDPDIRMGQQISLVVRRPKQLVRHDAGCQHGSHAVGWTTTHRQDHVCRAPDFQANVLPVSSGRKRFRPGRAETGAGRRRIGCG